MSKAGSSAASEEDLAASREARVAARTKARQEVYLHLIGRALRARLDSGRDPAALQEILNEGQQELTVLTQRLGGRIYPRQRPKATGSKDTCTVYIDECGAHSLTAKEKFEAFALAAVIIEDREFTSVDRQWKRWKRDHLG